MRPKLFLAAFAFLLPMAIGAVQAASPTVSVVETHPAGQSVVLAADRNFDLRLRYRTEKPIGIWISPYFHGKPVAAGTSPSPTYTGSGEALAWFFLSQPGQQVDEVRIRAGDGGADMPVVASYRVNVVARAAAAGSSNSPWAPSEPEWVGVLRADAERRLQTEMAAAQTDDGPGSAALLGVFMLAVAALGLTGLAAPVWAMRRWAGGWRLAAAVPLALVSFVILRIAVGTSIDPTSHNLWPFEVLIASLAALGIVIVLALARRLLSAGWRR